MTIKTSDNKHPVDDKQGEGIAILKLIGYVKNTKDARKFIDSYKVKDNKHYFQMQKMTLHGTEYDL